MKHTRTTFISAALFLHGCATNERVVHERAMVDLRCPTDGVTVHLKERPYVGRTHYMADGCDRQVYYVCQKKLHVFGIPLARADCTREPS